MADYLKLEVVTPSRRVLEGRAREIGVMGVGDLVSRR